MGNKTAISAKWKTESANRLTEADNAVQLIDLERYKDFFSGDAGLAGLVELILDRVGQSGMTLLCVGEQVIAQVSSRLNAQKSFQTRFAARLAQNPELLDELRNLLEDDGFVKAGSFRVEGGDS